MDGRFLFESSENGSIGFSSSSALQPAISTRELLQPVEER